ncbi:hypothetical protein BC826DRAFT_967850 [Russula brevipes]|nr:hypothetical protein BC826DRAFT_967850 [Russula brevipes]
MKKYLNVDIPSGNSRPQSSQSTYTLPVKRPASSLASAPPEQESHPRPATSTGHHRSASSSSLASAKSLPAKVLSRSEMKSTLTGQPVAGPSSKRRDNMPPPAVVPQRRQQVPSHPQVPIKRPLLAGQVEPKVIERPPEAYSSRAAAQILRPGSTQLSGPPVKQSAGPLRVESMAVKERLLGGPQRVLLPEVQPPPALSKPPLVPQEKKVSAEVQGMSRRSRLDSVRHGPKSSAAMDAKQAVTQVSATSSGAQRRPEPSQPAPLLAREKVVPIQATERKRDGPKPYSSGKGKCVGSKIPNVATEGEKGAEKRGSAPGRPKSSMLTRSISQGRVEAKPRKREDEPKGARPGVGKTSQSAIGSASIHVRPPKKVGGRTGGATQPTLSQLARMKAAEEEKERRAATKGPTKPLTIRSKGKAVHPRATSKVVEIPAAAIATPLPPSPEVRPADIPLPVSPLSAPLVAVETRDEQIAVPSTTDTVENLATDNEHPPVPTPTPPQVHPAQAFGVVMAAKTPISALVGSIQRGFLLSPNSPLSPAQPDVEWECPAWPGLGLNVGEEPSFEGVVESTMKRPLLATGVGTDPERVVVDMN